MKETKEKFKVRLGLFVIGGLSLFVLAIFIIGKQKNLFDPVIVINTSFYNVSGLQVGNNVRFSGINVGTVDKIEIVNDSLVRVDLMLKKSVQQFIKIDSEVGIGSEGIIGDRIITISKGSAEARTVEEGDHLASSEPVETDAIMASLEVTSLNAEIISHNLAEIVATINSGRGTLGKLIRDTSIAKNLENTMNNLESTSEDLEENMEAVKGSILFRNYFRRKQKEAEKKD